MKKFIIAISGLLSVGIGGAVAAQQIGQIQEGYVEEGNLLRSGNIIKTITMSNRGQNADSCKKACDADSECNAYSYAKQAANRKPVCYMRLIALPNRARRTHGYMQVVSGTKVSYLKDVHGLTPYAGQVVRNASQIRRFPVANEDPVACSDACYRDGSCKSYSYAPKGTVNSKLAMCVMNSTTGQLANQSGFLSGVKGTVRGKPVINRQGVKPVLKPRPKPVLTPRNPVVMKPKPKLIPDQNGRGNGGNEGTNPESFPGEMLDPSGTN